MPDINMNYISENVQRVLSVQKILSGNELTGITPGQIAKATDISPSNVTRALHNLLQAGVAELHPAIKGHWRLRVSYLTKTANDLLRELDKGQASVYDLKRYQTGR